MFRLVPANLPWENAPGLARTAAPPGPDDAAIALAPYGIAETGTLAYPAAQGRPGVMAFPPRTGDRGNPRRRHSSAFGKRHRQGEAGGRFPHTLNLVTGPSRTGDIEQTLELGAHGPKALAVLVVRDVDAQGAGDMKVRTRPANFSISAESVSRSPGDSAASSTSSRCSASGTISS